ncbi:amidohydrolase [Brevibacillus reuszeri]|uniref:Amidohydrolase n=1 Tax=Brevibacillus reuszeri TaxID=54915 RepID=A0A0K9YXX8_9BACL|nr:amidohydrolase [Brevibacillus reuszeri]KNB73095.1 amidohydrolase [Brevibacillus reuszeri]MED1856686.1 amidohydrolase [Brevibacillus reuszeri]GED68567.1 amidohydrolase [Brevibacillus reuszeri]
MNKVFVNGQIFTSHSDRPYASAMVIREGRIAWIGEEADLPECEGEKIDLHGSRVLPGLIDTHMHPLMLAHTFKQIACTPPALHSIEQLLGEIRAYRETHQDASVIQCWGYDEGKLTEGRAPSRWDLDQAASDVPVIVTRSCGHICAVNSFVLHKLGITRDTPNPQGGQIDKDENGEPTGILRENARKLVAGLLPSTSIEQDAASLAELGPHLFSHGITTIAELMARSEPTDYFETYQRAKEVGFQHRTVMYYLWDDLKKDPSLVTEKTDPRAHIHIGGVKLFADGSVSGQTAWVDPPFLETEIDGIAMTSNEELLEAGAFAEKHGIQLLIHAMGEKAIQLILDTFSGKKGWIPDAPSIRIEHAALLTEEMIRQASEAGIALIPQPIFLYAEIESYLNNLGAERTKKAYPIRSFLEAGVKVSISSDAPATAWADPANPFVGLKSAVTRIAYDGTDTGQEERIDVPTAVMLYTKGAQQVTRIPDIGQLAPGYWADFIVLDRDIFAIAPEEIDQVRVTKTYRNGELVYQRG